MSTNTHECYKIYEQNSHNDMKYVITRQHNKQGSVLTVILTGNWLTRFQLSFCETKREIPQPIMICGSWAE